MPIQTGIINFAITSMIFPRWTSIFARWWTETYQYNLQASVTKHTPKYFRDKHLVPLRAARGSKLRGDDLNTCPSLGSKSPLVNKFTIVLAICAQSSVWFQSPDHNKDSKTRNFTVTVTFPLSQNFPFLRAKPRPKYQFVDTPVEVDSF